MGVETHAHSRPSGCDMIMLFHGGTCETLFFTSWNTKTIGPFVGVAFGIFFFSILFEALKRLRESLYTAERKQKNWKDNEKFSNFMLNKYHLMQTGLHFLHVVLAYALMLIFMNFNYWQCLAMLLGLFVGFFFFGWSNNSAQDSNDCCY